MNQKLIEELSAKLQSLLQESPAADLEKNIHALLQSVFAKLALVSREEFDIQAELLRQTRAKLEQLQHTVDQLEQQQRSS